jgi:CheY-like chemotaxis protein
VGRNEIGLRDAGQLASALAHDFNNLLMVIVGYTHIIRRIVADPEAQRALDGIDRAGEQAAEITGQLLRFCRNEPFEKEDVSLNELISGAGELLKMAAGSNVQFRFQPDPGLRNVRANPGQMRQILMNLAMNARDAMPWGGTLIVETANVQAEPFVELTITDSGCGMNADTFAHLFESGFTTKPAGTGPGTGNGMGLATVHGIVTGLGGSIAVESAPGKGASFRIRIPATIAVAVPVSPPESGFRKTVLLLKKDEMLRNLLTTYLGEWDCTVLKAAGAEEAFALARGHGAIDLLIADIGDPGSDGMALAESLTGAMPRMQTLLIADCEGEFAGRTDRPAGAGILRHPFARAEFRNHVAGFFDPAA